MSVVEKSDSTSIEPLLNPENFRYTLKPINPTYESLWKLYKKQQDSYWKAEEISFKDDYYDFIKLKPEEQHFIKMVLAFFSSSDGIVNFNLRDRFLREIQVPEAQTAYGFQLFIEGIHSEVYSDMLINIIKDSDERNTLFNAIKEIEPVKKMADWAIKWIHSEESFAQRLIAFAIVEGVFFSGAFAAIFWLKKVHKETKLFMEGLIKSNRFIARDEGLHVGFACAMYKFIVNRVDKNTVYNMFKEAVDIAYEFSRDAIAVDMIGMNLGMMHEYIKYVADRLLVMLGYEKLYFTVNPFDFMQTIGLDSKDNFFENRPDAYQSAYTGENIDWTFEISEDF
uniref:Uncharacterized protein n=1 Tax=viral metagenome TaxID=1070528 RepID=A0A6C0EBJ7_9ZZZZ